MNNTRQRFSIRRVHFVLPALIVLTIAAVAIHHFVNIGIIFALGNAGPGSGAAIRPGCTWELAVSHCTEATWRYYAIGESNTNGNIQGTADGAVVHGTVDPTAPGTTITGCAKAGGYWRYALVSNKDWVNDAGVPFSQGEQVGVGSIGSGGGEHSNMFGGREQYSANPRSGGGGTDWNYVHQQFEESKAKGYLQTGMTWDAGSALGWFCAEPPEGTDTPPPTLSFSCADYGSYTINYGRTYAEAAVQNLSARYGSKTAATDVNTSAVQGLYNNGWKVTTAGSDAQRGPGDYTTKIYARPGDSIQFRHTLCWGNQKVTGNWDFKYGVGRTEQNTVKAWQYNNKRNTFQIIATPGNHNFDGATGTSSFIGTGWYTIKETAENFSSSTVGSGRNITGESFSGGKTYRSNEVVTSSYGVRFFSPHTDAYDANNPRYSCQATVFLSNKYVLPGFQIPGFGSGFGANCNTTTIAQSDVGVKISQKLQANIVKSWVARKTEISGTCACSIRQSGCAGCTAGSYSAKETGTKEHYLGSTVTFSEKSDSEWQSKKAKVNPSGTIYTHVPHWGTTSMDDWWLPSSDSGGGLGDDANKPHGAHYEDYDAALGGGGTWGDGRYNGGCRYSTCSSSCNHSRVTIQTAPPDPNYDAYGNVTSWTYYYLTFYCTQDVTVTGRDGTVNESHVENKTVTKTLATARTGSWGYPYRSVNYGDVTKTAEVYTPYNYTTSVSTAIPTSPLYVGEKVEVSANVSFNPRSSEHVSTVSYATITKPTSIKFVQFAVPEGTTFDNISGVDTINGKVDSTQDPCAYYSPIRQGGTDCIVVDESLLSPTVYNPQGSYSGERKTFGAYTRTVPDLSNFPAGTKYCTAVGVFPSDSYDAPKATSIGYGQVEGPGMSTSGAYWNVSGLTCRTIAKKPNFQVWGAGAYTGSYIRTSISKKDVGANFGKVDFNATGLFGSWSEYTAIARGTITNFASGATLGYKKYNLSANTGGYPGDVNNYSHCKDLSIMSLAHDNCGTTVGNSGITASSAILLNRIEARYNSNKSFNRRGSVTSINQYQRMNNDNTSFNYVSLNGGGSMGSLTFTPSSNYQANNTYVTYVAGDLTINGNICYGNSGSCNNTVKTLGAQDTGNASYTGSAQLPQSLIIVDGNIKISENVTRIDSWLIARNGNINTCNGYKVGQIIEENEHGDAEYITGSGYLNSQVCKETLIINGPVFAKSLDLVRTAGAWSGGGQDYSGNVKNRDYTDPTSNGSVAPAEIFNLRADSYLWAYDQAQRYSEAVVTYTRELAPRY
ncbi:hypothetical protein IJG66_00930 [Candidatus Saccharibacteria bacterium]|nr:hypothetical protein [Candidatus Saccharibacteria bacterium]